MKKPYINIKITLTREDDKISIRMKGHNFDEKLDAKDMPEDQRLLWETALVMLGAATNETGSN
jgi:hypothetical protein